MALRFIAKDPNSPDNDSPTIYDNGDSYVLQGFRVTDAGMLDDIGDIPAHETVIVFPKRMMPFFPEASLSVSSYSSSSARAALEALGQRLREIRIDAGLTGRDLARLAGWHSSKVSKIEYARQVPTVDSLSIVPSGIHRHRSPTEDFWIFDDRRVNVELVSGWLTITAPHEVSMYVQAHQEFAEMAVSGKPARDLVTAAISALS